MNDGQQSGDGYVQVTVAGASDAVCLGRPATIIAKAGGVTRGTPGNDVIVGSKAADRVPPAPGATSSAAAAAPTSCAPARAPTGSPPVPAKTGS